MHFIIKFKICLFFSFNFNLIPFFFCPFHSLIHFNNHHHHHLLNFKQRCDWKMVMLIADTDTETNNDHHDGDGDTDADDGGGILMMIRLRMNCAAIIWNG